MNWYKIYKILNIGSDEHQGGKVFILQLIKSINFKGFGRSCLIVVKLEAKIFHIFIIQI